MRPETGVELIAGTPARINDIRAAALGTEAVISTLNNARASDNPWAKPISPPMFMTDPTRNVLTVMGEQNIRRIVTNSTMGAGDDWARIGLMARLFINMSNIKAGFVDTAASMPWCVPPTPTGRSSGQSRSPTSRPTAPCGPRKPAPKSRVCGSTVPTSLLSSWMPSNRAAGSTGLRLPGICEVDTALGITVRHPTEDLGSAGFGVKFVVIPQPSAMLLPESAFERR